LSVSQPTPACQRLKPLGFPTFNGTAEELAEKVHSRGAAVAQALLPVLCFLLLSQQRTAKSGCATDLFRKLFSCWRSGWRVVTHTREQLQILLASFRGSVG
jgi:hypothetical protein